MLKLKLIDLKAISSDSLALKKILFPLAFYKAKRATKSFYQGKLNKERKTFEKKQSWFVSKTGYQYRGVPDC